MTLEQARWRLNSAVTMPISTGGGLRAANICLDNMDKESAVKIVAWLQNCQTRRVEFKTGKNEWEERLLARAKQLLNI